MAEPTSAAAITPKPKLPKALLENPEQRFFNRELSWLAFNERVLEEAGNLNHPLLERIKFLSISASNLDEFYMVRVAGLNAQLRNRVTEKSQDGLLPREQLRQVNHRANELMHDQQTCWRHIHKELEKEGILIVEASETKAEEKKWLEEYFTTNIFPALTPIAIDPAHPFPFIPNLSIAMVLRLEKQTNVSTLHKNKGPGISKQKHLKAIILLPQKLQRFIQLPDTKGKHTRVVLLEEVISLFMDRLFPGWKVKGSGLIRINRDSELEVVNEAEDLVQQFETAVKRRRRGTVIRLKISANLPDDLKEFVIEEFQVKESDIVVVDGMIGLSGLSELYDIKRPDLKFAPYKIRFPERIQDYNGNCFDAIAAKDLVIHHPYESFDVVVRFLRQAAADPDVVAIKQTLYRTSNDSPIVKALIEAAEAGKSVTAMVELKARFDEEANIRWGRDLERVGAQVVYGMVGLKTHAKVSLVVRRVDGGLRTYVHFGTGNYHPATAKIYTDLSYFTTDPALCRDAARLFNYLTGYAPPENYEKISVAPLSLRPNLLQLIRDEINHAKAGKPAGIWAKQNSIVDPEIIDALYEASQYGVKIDLIVRGICCLRPGVKGLSENIRVKSIVGRFLEHSRIFCFGNGYPLPSPENKVFISSADWMPRNLDWRVEVLVPIENATVHQQILNQIMNANIKDEKQSWMLESDGKYTRVKYKADSFSAHEFFMNNPSLSGRGTAIHGKK
ncbi:MAG: RNA degradosome polyphosphate kinase [Proteobacteria bacterium]|nr:RNA degradosome polyphosphate kinase [Pseudomonadota bacterium]